ncbi:UNVERIFIED_CONTAM: hypothetical protein FKN15_053781 [Acipenser sinensis]
MLDNEAFGSFVFYSTLLIIKMYIVAIITGQVRLRKKVRNTALSLVTLAHHNDMENIFPFLFLGAVYSMTEPTLLIARTHFQVFFLGRVVHTVAYLLALKAPTRSLAYIVAQVPCFSMAVR